MRLYCIEDRQAPFIDAFVKSSTIFGFSPEVIRPKSNESSAFARFRELYRHLSINPEGFELACFRRYFEVAKMVSEGERFIISDSDLLVNARPADIPSMLMDDANALVGSVGRTDGVTEDDISPHFSFWTPALIRRFVDYLIHIYESQDGRLERIFRERQEAGNKRAAISDMTLLRMFTLDDSIQFVDSNQILDDMVVDHNFCMAECANASFKMSFGFKAFRREQERLYVTSATGQRVQPVVIHLQGRAKIASASLQLGDDRTARVRLAAIAAGRIARNWLA
jgi:hypothetical protein